MERVKGISAHLVSSSTSSTSRPDSSAQILAPKEILELSVPEIRSRYGTAAPGAIEIDGVNHVAFVCSDMAKTIWFWCEVLGLRLTKTIALPNGGQHFFMDGGRGASIAYFWFPDAPKQAKNIASADFDGFLKGDFATAHGSVNHVAFNVPVEKLGEYRKRIKSSGHRVTKILYHTDETESGLAPQKDENTTWQSFYFSGPDGELLEITSQNPEPFTPEKDITVKPKDIHGDPD